VHLTHINAWCADLVHIKWMPHNHVDAEYYLRRAEEYRDKARATDDARLRSALESVAREFMRKARELDASVPRITGIQ